MRDHILKNDRLLPENRYYFADSILKRCKNAFFIPDNSGICIQKRGMISKLSESLSTRALAAGADVGSGNDQLADCISSICGCL